MMESILNRCPGSLVAASEGICNKHKSLRMSTVGCSEVSSSSRTRDLTLDGNPVRTWLHSLYHENMRVIHAVLHLLLCNFPKYKHLYALPTRTLKHARSRKATAVTIHADVSAYVARR